MRLALFMAASALLGCGRTVTTPTGHPSSPPTDPVAAKRDEDAQAAYSLDSACASIADALDGTKKLAPTAGGDAKEALLDIADMLDSAGATLADHDDPPPSLEEYRRTEAEQASDRQKAVNDALDALHELRDAQGTLDDLAQNVPEDKKAPLTEIQSQTDEAIDSVESAIKRLGGKVPPEEDGD